MNCRMEKFALEYAKSGNATQSAIAAGYSEKTAYSTGARLLKNVEIQKLLAELHEKMESDKIADAREMQERLTAIIRQELDEEQIVVEGCGEGVSEARKVKKKASFRDITKAIDTLARMQGAFNDRATVEVVLPVFDGEDDLE